MQQTITHSDTIRFRRFSRKGYAVFCSLSRNVTIGQLAIDIADCQQRKASKEFTQRTLIQEDAKEQSDFEVEIAQDSLMQQLALNISLCNQNKGAAAHTLLYTLKNNISCSVFPKTEQLFFILNRQY